MQSLRSTTTESVSTRGVSRWGTACATCANARPRSTDRSMSRSEPARARGCASNSRSGPKDPSDSGPWPYRSRTHNATIEAMAQNRVRVLLVDDHEVVRDGVKSLINANDDLLVVGEAGSVREAVDQAMRTKPDVVVMDVRLADGSGIEATRGLVARLEKTQVLMLTSFADDEALFASIMAGASGYVLKQIRGGELIRAIREVGAGKSLLDPEVTRTVLERLRKGKTMRDEKLARLSAQEEGILTLVAKGLTNGQIGEQLKLAAKTAKNYVSTILSKLEVARRAEAAAYLARHTTTPGSTP